MGIGQPFHRTCRQFVDGQYAEGGRSEYITHKNYAIRPEQYVRAFLILQKDLLTLFDYIEPSDINLNTYSFRTHELLFRACVEIEANFKAIFIENGRKIQRNWGIKEYKKINKTHRLSSYEIKLPY